MQFETWEFPSFISKKGHAFFGGGGVPLISGIAQCTYCVYTFWGRGVNQETLSLCITVQNGRQNLKIIQNYLNVNFSLLSRWQLKFDCLMHPVMELDANGASRILIRSLVPGADQFIPNAAQPSRPRKTFDGLKLPRFSIVGFCFVLFFQFAKIR